MSWQDWLSTILLVAGAGFYLTGTLGILRFPDTCSRLHALTKADNLGLLLVSSALAVHSNSLRVASLLLVVWVFGLAASTVSAHLIARHSLREGSGEEA